MAWANGYTRTSTAAHKRWAKQVKANAHGRCQLRLPGCTGRADHADHIVAVAEGGAEFDVANGCGACASCHAVKTQGEAARGRARRAANARRPAEQHPGILPSA